MKKQTALKIFLWVAMIAVMAAIFCFSAENADESGETSGAFVRAVLGLFPAYNKMRSAAQDALVESVMYAVRKLAHFSVYAGLGFFMHSLVRQYTKKRTLLLTALFSAAYAASDELHQFFVPGRSCKVTDVFIDTAGAVVGALIAAAFAFIWRKWKNMNTKRI